MKTRPIRLIVISFLLIGFCYVGFRFLKRINFNFAHTIGEPIDSLNGVKVFYNGGVDHVSERNLGPDNYNLGLKYQCVEFVKRYYYEYLKHKMPDTYGHAKDFFDKNVKDGTLNEKRNLIQYSNPSIQKPKASDLIIYSGSIFNSYGHVAIVSDVKETQIEIIQQNPGSFGKSRINIPLKYTSGKWEIKESRILGWLRKE